MLIFSVCVSQILNAQISNSKFWSFTNTNAERSNQKQVLTKLPDTYKRLHLDFLAWKNELNQAKEQRAGEENAGIMIQLPSPNGDLQDFYIVENSVIAPEYKHLTTVRTYEGFMKKNPGVMFSCSYSSTGFMAFVYDGNDSYTIEPIYHENTTDYIIYYKKNHDVSKINCLMHEKKEKTEKIENIDEGRNVIPSSLRTFRVAISASGEFGAQWGGSPFDTMKVTDKIIEGVNLINPIYKRDLGIKLQYVLSRKNIYAVASTDPFTGTASNMADQNQPVVDMKIGTANYDIGHVIIWANIGGVGVQAACDGLYKGMGSSASNASMNTLFIDYFGHEIGHQLKGDHNFVSNECMTSDNNFRNEPGEGSSIMSYAGVCGGAATYQSSSDPYFHSASINAMNTFIANTATCATLSTPGAGNSAAPVADAKANITIPKGTPFVLVGSGSDANDAASNLTYGWEQNDGAGSAVNGSPNCMSTSRPLFRYRSPVSANFRIFPEMPNILTGDNNAVTWEKLPCIARNLNFNLIVRDNNINWGRIGNSQMLVTVANTGPFAVIVPNGGETWSANSTQTITWSENGTAAHCANVDILISTDNGVTFTTLLAATPNDGSQAISVPNNITSDARILIQCAVSGATFKTTSTFFDVSNAVFNITAPLPIELTKFDVTKNAENQVVIDWKTASESNSSHFEVEKSNDGQDFESIASIKSQRNSSTLQTYNFVDKNPAQGINYYRLRSVDLDGRFEYSLIKSVTIEKLSKFVQIYPNPAKDEVNIKVSNTDENVVVKIFDQLGRVVQEFNLATPTINVSGLPNGVYYFKIMTENQIFDEKIVIKK